MLLTAKMMVAILFGSICTIFAGREVFVVAPNDLEHTEGNSFDLFPFLIQQTSEPSMRYQQVYDAYQFSAVSLPGAYITYLFLRPDGASEGAIGSTTNIQINFSTTHKVPDSLSSVFSENVGADDTVAFGPDSLSFGSFDSSGSPKFWDVQIRLTTPFWYNPTLGNLLLEVRIRRWAAPIIGNVSLDCQSVASDSVSRAYAPSVDAISATQVDSLGLVTAFFFSPLPTLQIQQTTNSTTNCIVITWPVRPDIFVLQSTDKIGSQSNWRQVTNQIVETPPLRTLTFPRDSLGVTKFFRLIWESGRPASQGSVAPPLESKLITPNTH